jgi:predicted outer membrane repeat protein
MGIPVHVENGCTLEGWDPYDATNPLDPNDPDGPWDSWTNNIWDDPNFVMGPLGDYYLSQIGAGHLQLVDSNCVDAGSTDADDPEVSLHTLTTRTDLVPDSNRLDLGYHYPLRGIERELVLTVIGPGTVAVDPNQPDPCNVLYDPSNDVYTYRYYSGTVLLMTATPEPGYRVKSWSGTDDDPSWNITTNTVLMDGDKTVVVEFEQDITKLIKVPLEYDTIEQAIAAAPEHDTKIIVSRGIHFITNPDGIDFQGKSITLMSIDPDDPEVIAATVIDCQGYRYSPQRAFHFQSGEGPNTVLEGFTIRNGLVLGAYGLSGSYGIPQPDPYEPFCSTQSPLPPRAERGEDASGTAYGGGILCENASSPTIRNCVIEDCNAIGAWAGDGAPGFDQILPYDPWFYIALDGSIQTSNHGQWGGHGGTANGTGYGGGIACRGESSPIIENCIIRNNAARGGMAGNGGDGGNAAGGAGSHGGDGGDAIGNGLGGGIYCENGSQPIIRNCSFISNLATSGIPGRGGSFGGGQELIPTCPMASDGYAGATIVYGAIGGGAVACVNTDVNLFDCTFNDNQTYETQLILEYVYNIPGENQGIYLIYEEARIYAAGAAVYSGIRNITTINNCEFVENLGGAIYIEPNCVLDVDECLFRNNTDAPEGGAIYAANGGYMDINRATFIGNSASGDGGAINTDSDANFTSCLFHLNSTGSNGGAIEAFYDTPINDPNIRRTLRFNFESCTFTRNEAIESQTGWGGALYIYDFDASFTNCDFVHNTARAGGALCLVLGNAAFDSGVINENKCIGGAAISAIGLGLGGGLICVDTPATIENYTIKDNVAAGIDGSGGGINFYGGYVTHLVKNCLIAGNKASVDGGGISCNLFATPQVQNCTFSNNYARMFGGAIFCDWTSDLQKVSDSIFDNCNTRAICEEDVGNSVIEYSLFNNNPEGDYGIYNSNTELTTTIAGVDLSGTNIEDDPLFVTGLFGDYYLDQSASPAVDAGSDDANNLGLDTFTTDPNGINDTGLVDIGYHFHDPLNVPQFTLTASVIGEHGTIEPNSATVYGRDGMNVVEVTATVDGGYKIKKWTGTDDDSSFSLTQYITMLSDRVVSIEYESVSSYHVPGEFPSISAALYATDLAGEYIVRSGDRVIVSAGTYNESNIDFDGRSIIISSEHPDDPCIVAATVIDCGGSGRAFIFRGGEKGAVIDGFTIINGDAVGYSVLTAPGGFPRAEDGEDAYGGAIISYGPSSPTISNCVIKDCIARGRFGGHGLDRTPEPDPPICCGPGGDGGDGGDGYGGAMYFAAGSEPTIINCQIIHCRAIGGNGGTGGDAYDTGSRVCGYWGGDGGQGGNAYGGAMYFEADCKVTIRNSFIRRCSTTQGEGNVGGDGWPSGVPDTICGRGGDGGDSGTESYYGAIYYGPQCEVVVSDTTMVDNAANTVLARNVWAGGDGATPAGDDGDPGYNIGIGFVGGNYYSANSKVELTNCTFTRTRVIVGTTYGFLGGIGGGGGCEHYETLCTAVHNNCTFTESIGYNGGFQYFDQDCSVKANDCRYGNNHAENDGGAVYFGQYCTFDMNSCNFWMNSADRYNGHGGALYWEDGFGITIDNSVIVSNEAGIGGGLYWLGEGSDATISRSTIYDNTADHGGGLYWAGSAPKIKDCIIGQNVAEGYELEIEWEFFQFYEDVYGGGGGIFCWRSDAIIEDCLINDNSATGSGGGVYFGGGDTSPVLKNCVVKRNSAVIDGGGIASYWYMSPTIRNCTIIDNTTYDPDNSTRGRGGGLACSYESQTTLIDSILWGNTGIHGNQIAIGSGSDPDVIQRPTKLTVSHCDIESGCEGIYVEPGRELICGPDNIDADPIFVPGAYGSYYLSQIDSNQTVDSPCVDAGSGNVDDPNIDMVNTYTTRTDGINDFETVDIGYHYRSHIGLPTFQLFVSVVGGHGEVQPTEPLPVDYNPVTGAYTYYEGTRVILTATADEKYRIGMWTGTDNDASKAFTNLVTITSDTEVTVQFEQPRTIVVGSESDYATIERAVDAAEDGDIVVLPSSTYTPPSPYGGIQLLDDKRITITSTNPDDPDCVASTVLQGFVFYISTNRGAEAIIDGITIRFGTMNIVSCSPNIRNCVFDQCNWFGVDGDTVEDMDATNGVSVEGGAMEIYDGSPLVQNCAFTDCSVTGGDGGVGFNGRGQHPDGFDGGWAGWAYGGAVYCGPRSNPIFEHCSFTDCNATGGSGGNGGNAADPTVDYGGRGGNWTWGPEIEDLIGYWWDGWEWGPYDIDGNARTYIFGYLDPFGYYRDYWKYSGYGGAVYIEEGTSPKFIDCTFTNNRAYGGVCGVGGIGFLVPRPSRNLNIETYGGAVYAAAGSSPEFTNCVISNNIADTSTIALPDDIYVSYGGGIAYEDGSSPKFTNCTFSNNVACLGGGMYWSDSTATIVDSEFSDNTAYHGAGLYSVESDGTITGSVITGNRAQFAILPTDPNDANIPNIGGIFAEGGGYFCLSSTVDIFDSIFTQNRASASGGAIYYSGGDQDLLYSPLLHNSLITHNFAGRDGGGISANWFMEPVISNCTIADNDVRGLPAYGGGLYCSYYSNVELINSIIWGNTSSYEGAQVAVCTGAEFSTSPSTLTVSYSDIQPEPNDPNILEPVVLDLVFCIDTTGSMFGAIDAVKVAAAQLVNSISNTIPDYRIGIVTYEDYGSDYGFPDDHPYEDVLDFSNDLTTIVNAINSITLGFGGDGPETVYAGLLHAIDPNAMEQSLIDANETALIELGSPGIGSWRSGSNVRRVIILIGDAQPKDPEPHSGLVLDDIVTAATTGPTPVSIFSIVAGYGILNPFTQYYFNALAEGTGGARIEAETPDEVVDAIMDVVQLIGRVASMIYVEDGCTLNGWDWNPDANGWVPNFTSYYNIAEDPLFVAGYYLSQIASSQPADSPCVDAGSDDANNPDIALDTYTTRTDGVNDVNIVDMGYHYDQGLIGYHLTVSVVDANGDVVDPNVGHGYVLPDSAVVYEGFGSNVINLTAYPELGYKVKQWTGTDDDTTTSRYNTVTLTEDKHVTIEFERAPLYNLFLYVINRGYGPNGTLEPETPPVESDPNFGFYRYYAGTDVALIATPDPNYEVRLWYGTDDDSSKEPNNVVTMDSNNVFVAVEFGLIGYNIINLYDENMVLDSRSPFPTIQSAVDAAGSYYTVELTKGLYTGLGNYNVNLRAGLDPNQVRPITVRSTDPTDPEVVANTIIDCEGEGRAFIFNSGEDPNYIVSGITITNGFANFGGAILCDGASPAIRNCRIVNNTAIGNGGAIYCTNASPWIINSEISGNSSGGFGGGIYAEAGSIPEIINCLITFNSSGDIGGAMYLYDSPAVITLSTIAYNYGLAYEENMYGPIPIGGIACRDSSPIISNCIIGSNGNTYWMYGDILWAMWGDPFYAGDDLYGFTGGVTYSCIEEGTFGDDTTNIDSNPLWVTGGLGPFYLSQTQSGQPQTSPCVNTGEQYILQTLQTTYNLGNITTSIMNYTDVGYADMGYHYPFLTGPPVQYSLMLFVSGNGRLEYSYYSDFNDVNAVIEPNESPVVVYITPGTSVQLRAIPDPNYRVFRWSGTNDDTSFSQFNSVTMYGNRAVFLEFEPAVRQILDVATDGQYTYLGIQDAIDDARDGDMVLLHSGTYAGIGFEVIGKNITITGTNPDDPGVVASTIIDCAGEIDGGIHLLGTPGGTCVLSGVTIINANTRTINAPGPQGTGARGIDGSDNMPYAYASIIDGGYSSYAYINSNAAITVIGNHIISNCIIRDCSVTAGNGSGGNTGEEDMEGGNGGNGGFAGGAGIYIGDIFDYYYDYDLHYHPNYPNDANWAFYDYNEVLVNWGGSPLIKDCIIDNCIAIAGNGANGGNGSGDRSGGGAGGVPGRALGAGIYCDMGTKPTIINCTITNCQVIGSNAGNGGDAGASGVGGYGGLSYADPCQPDPEIFSAYGAGIYCGIGCEPNIINCTFGNNITNGSVSGVGGFSSPSGIQQQPRINYNIPSYGAGVYCDSGCSPKFANCTFRDNFTTYYGDLYTGYGGGICLDGGKEYDEYYAGYTSYYSIGLYSSYYYSTYIFDSNFTSTVSATFTDCRFSNNSAPVGGGVYATVSDVNITDCNFAGNTSFIGGAVCLNDSSTTISGCTIHNNIVSPDADPNSTTPDGVTYGTGGGIFSLATDTLIRDCDISNNVSSGSGGGVYLAVDPNIETDENQVLKNCLITNNIAGRDGGGVSVNWRAHPIIYNCTIADNNVSDPNGYGAGLYCSYEGNVEVIDSIIWGNWGNVGINGTQIALCNNSGLPYSQTSSVTVAYSDVQGWQDVNNPDWIDPNAVFVDADIDANEFLRWDFNTVIDADPLFISGYYLSHVDASQSLDSPCIDSGSGYADDPNIDMARYTTRIDGVNDVDIVDMGYHYTISLHRLTVYVVGGNGDVSFDPSGHLDVDPNSRWYNQHAIVTLKSIPDPNYRVKGWYDVNDVLLSIGKSMEVVMDSDMVIKVQYELPDIVHVSGGGNAIQQAIDAARSGDTLIVFADTYDGNINLQGKDITVVSANPDDPNVIAMTIIDCQQTGRGFIFNSNEGPNTVIDGFTVINGSITGQGGGAIFVDVNSSPTIVNVTMNNCSVTGANGGAIYVDANSSPTFINCVITNCSADNGGGAHCDANSSPIFKHCNFRFNSAAQVGGAMLCDPNVSITIKDCNFIDNTASFGGALYFAENSSGEIIDSMIERNDANEDGGALYLAEANDLLVVDCNISYNTAIYGAGLYSLGSLNIIIDRCSFNFNWAPFGFVDPNDPNTAVVGQGGGMYCFATEALIRDCTFNHNHANTSGGGMYLAGESDYIDIKNCLIINNLAGRDGGGISANWYSEPNITNCTFASNAAPGVFGQPISSGFGGGLYCSYYSNVEVSDSILWNNYALKGYEIAVATGFEFEPRPSKLMISYSAIKRTASAVWVDSYCTLLDPDDPTGQTPLEDTYHPEAVWISDSNNIDDDPNFVTGRLGHYYLSHTDAGQAEDSPCIDAGSDLAFKLGMVEYTTRTDDLPDTRMVDMGYHYPLDREKCRFCDLFRDGIINFRDYAIFAMNWLEDDCFNEDATCQGADLTFDSNVDFNDLTVFVECWLVEDTEAPIPNPSEWAIVPHWTPGTSPYSISMTARTAYDAWGWSVQYYFDCVFGDCHDSGWQDSTEYEDTNLDLGIYTYRVKARDELGNETKWSVLATTGEEDTTPPAPNPVILTIQAVSQSSITMSAQESYDESGVEYYFDCNTIGGHDSGWQSEPNYTDVNLVPDTQYCYKVIARDMAGNYTPWSSPVCTTTLMPPDTLPPEPNVTVWDPVADANGYDGYPREVILDPFGQFDYGATMRAIDTDDVAPAGVTPSEVEYYFECVTDSGFDSGWRTVAAYPDEEERRTYTVKIGGSGHSYIFRVRARDASANHNMTDWSEPWPAVIIP